MGGCHLAARTQQGFEVLVLLCWDSPAMSPLGSPRMGQDVMCHPQGDGWWLPRVAGAQTHPTQPFLFSPAFTKLEGAGVNQAWPTLTPRCLMLCTGSHQREVSIPSAHSHQCCLFDPSGEAKYPSVLNARCVCGITNNPSNRLLCHHLFALCATSIVLHLCGHCSLSSYHHLSPSVTRTTLRLGH